MTDMIFNPGMNEAGHQVEASKPFLSIESLGSYYFEISGPESLMYAFLDYVRVHKSPTMDPEEITATLKQSPHESAALNFGIFRFILQPSEIGKIKMKARINGGEANTNEYGPQLENMIHDAISSINH
jgi:hypothetical protein